MGDLSMAELDVLQIKVEDVDVSQVPELIQGKFAKMSELKNQIERASSKAFDAKEAIIAVKEKHQDIIRKNLF